MEEVLAFHLQGDWQHLPEQVLKVAQSWQTFWTDVYAQTGETFSLDSSGSNTDFIKHLLWLILLAEELQRPPKLHGLFPVVHHAMIDLQFTSGSYKPSIGLFAPVEGVFKATQIITVSPVFTTVEIGRGDAATVSDLIEKFIEPEMQPDMDPPPSS